jgi:vancomycin resistance protein VanJ
MDKEYMTELLSKWLRRIVSASVLAYTALLVGWAIAHRLIGDGFWILGLINAFAVYLFAPLPLVILAAVLGRRRELWGAASIVTALFVASFGRDLLPQSPVVRADTDAPSLTVMTYNVLFSAPDAGPIADNVLAAGADIVAFQELTPWLERRLEQQIGGLYPYHTPVHARCRAEVAVWSRYPLQVEPVDLVLTCHVRPVVIDFEGHTVRVIGIHGLSFTGLDRTSVELSFRWRKEQIKMVLGMIDGQAEPLILLGDLNSTPAHEVYRMLSADLTDAYREAGWGLGHTFPATGNRFWGVPYPNRLVRIDHIFHSAEWRSEAAWVSEWDGSSDHLAVVARLRLAQID